MKNLELGLQSNLYQLTIIMTCECIGNHENSCGAVGRLNCGEDLVKIF